MRALYTAYRTVCAPIVGHLCTIALKVVIVELKVGH